MKENVLIHLSPACDHADCLALGDRLSEALEASAVVESCSTDSPEDILETVRAVQPAVVVTGSPQPGPQGVVGATEAAAALIDMAGAPVAIAPRRYAARWDPRWLRIGAGFASEDGSSAAVNFGSDLARASGATLVVLTVADTTTWGFREAGWRGVTEYLRAKQEQAKRTLRIGARQAPGVVPCGMRLERGDAAAELRAAAEHLDVLVLGAAGPRHGSGISPIGDLAGAIEGMPSPVIVVPERSESLRHQADRLSSELVGIAGS